MINPVKALIDYLNSKTPKEFLEDLKKTNYSPIKKDGVCMNWRHANEYGECTSRHPGDK